jgi:hypothetical protein
MSASQITTRKRITSSTARRSALLWMPKIAKVSI